MAARSKSEFDMGCAKRQAEGIPEHFAASHRDSAKYEMCVLASAHCGVSAGPFLDQAVEQGTVLVTHDARRLIWQEMQLECPDGCLDIRDIVAQRLQRHGIVKWRGRFRKGRIAP